MVGQCFSRVRELVVDYRKIELLWLDGTRFMVHRFC